MRQRGKSPCHQHLSSKRGVFGPECESLAHKSVGYELHKLTRDDIGVG